MDLLARIRHRKMIQWAFAYSAGAFVVLQAVDILGGQFGLSVGVERAVTILLAAGLVAAVIVAWYHGERGAQAVPAIEIVMLGLLATATAGILWLVRNQPATALPEALAAVAVREDPVDGPNIAVLPFTDLSASADSDRLAHAIHDQTLNYLARVPGLNPVARTSVVALADLNLTSRQIADTLNVRYVLEGSVQHQANRVKVIAQLIDPRRHDAHLAAWDTVFLFVELFSLQESVAKWIVDHLTHSLGVGGQTDAAFSRARVPAAYDAYLHGRALANSRTREGLTAAIKELERSVQLDSLYAPAQAALAFTYGLWGAYAHGPPYANYETFGRALLLADRAARIDPNSGDAAATRSYLLSRVFAPDAEIERGFRHALNLLPASADVQVLYATFLTRKGDGRQALHHAQRAVTLDPVSVGRYAALGWSALAHGDFALAQEAAERASVIEPDIVTPRLIRALALVLEDRADECLQMDLKSYAAVRAICMHAAGQPAEARAVVDSLQRAGVTGPAAAYIGSYFGFIGDVRRTLSALEQSFAETPFGLDFRLINSPVFQQVQADERFQRGWASLRADVWRRVERARHRAEMP